VDPPSWPAGGQSITVIKNATGVFVRGAVNTVRVTAADVTAGGSVVHIVDGVLLPPTAVPPLPPAFPNSM
jgi:uncharacterized surface protein with fasciclin (FAS1) repeats